MNTTSNLAEVIQFPSSPDISQPKTSNKQSSVSTPSKNHGRCTVDPIRDKEDIAAARQYFLNQPQRYQSCNTNIRNYALFVLGINCARRIGDLLNLTMENVVDANGELLPYLNITERKTRKPARVILNDDAKDALSKYIAVLKDYSTSDYLFKSREGANKAIDTRSAWRIMKQMSRNIGLDKKGINVGTHTMRKTAATAVYNATKDIELVADMLNHSYVKVTKRYIGLCQSNVDTAIMNLSYT